MNASTAVAHPYDATAKQFLSQTPVLAYILQHTIKEFRDCPLQEIMNTCIDEDVRTSSQPVHPRRSCSPLTLGLRNEDNSVAEGDVWYDILFRARLPQGNTPVGVIVNVEAQSRHPSYPLLKRAFYYGARLLSAQRSTWSDGNNYAQLEKVYSIWIVTDPPAMERDTIAVYSTQEASLHGLVQRDPETYDLLTVVMVALPKPGCYNEEARFTETMATLLSPSASAQSKARALEQSMGPSISLGLREELDAMTSLGEWAIEIGMEQGREQGLEQGRASGIEQATLNSLQSLMRTMHLDAPSAMDALEIPADQRPHYLELLLAS